LRAAASSLKSGLGSPIASAKRRIAPRSTLDHSRFALHPNLLAHFVGHVLVRHR